MECNHKFIDSNKCGKCGVPHEVLSLRDALGYMLLCANVEGDDVTWGNKHWMPRHRYEQFRALLGPDASLIARWERVSSQLKGEGA